MWLLQVDVDKYSGFKINCLIMGAKTTAWNEFSSTMASAVICLATNQKFNLFKYIFDNMMKKLDSVTNFLMYPRKRLLRKGYIIISNNDGISSRGNGRRRTKRKDTKVPQLSVPISVADEAVNEEMDDSLKMASTIATGLDAECQKVIRETAAHTRSERMSKISNDLLLAGVNTPRSEEDSLKLTELMEICTNLQQKIGLSTRVESSANESLGEDDASKQGRIAHITLVSTHDEQMFDAQDLGGEKVFVAQQDENVIEKEVDATQIQVKTVATTLIISIDEATLAQALAELKHEKPRAKAKGIVFHEPKESTTTTAAITKSKSQDNELNDEENAKLFMQLLKKKRKFFAGKRAKEKRNKPPTQVQQRKIMCTYLKNIEGKKLINLKNKSFDYIQKMFDRAFKRVNTFVNYRTELIEESSKKTDEKVTE
nr:hypothetical protein [Tanacetum cinerariifolium]